MGFVDLFRGRSQSASVVSCGSCRSVVSKSPMRGTTMQLYNGVYCEHCRGIECTPCKQRKGRIDAPCSFCGAAVSPAFEHLVGR